MLHKYILVNEIQIIIFLALFWLMRQNFRSSFDGSMEGRAAAEPHQWSLVRFAACPLFEYPPQRKTHGRRRRAAKRTRRPGFSRYARVDCFVTLVVTVNGPETIWLLADRRLSSNGRAVKEDARKVMFLDTTDAVAILGYAGLGATALGTEPADWMSAVLRGRNLPLEQSLGVLAEAMKKQFPQHMRQMPSGGGPPAHSMIVPAFLGKEVRLYTIDMAFAPDRKSYAFRYTRHVVDEASYRTPRVVRGGSGAPYLTKDKRWMRSLLRLVNAHDRKQVGPHAVADYLAKLNDDVSRHVKSVGPRCIVAWRHRKGGVHNGGGAQQSYTGTTRDSGSPPIPAIATGIDMPAFLNVLVPQVTKMFDAMEAGQSAPKLNEDEIKAALARLPDKPDEDLR